MPERTAGSTDSAERPYPLDWEGVAELRVFRTTEERWQRLMGWRSEIRRKGWRLLRVSAVAGEMVAVFGRTKDELLDKRGAAS
jgi:hypothetical protein